MGDGIRIGRLFGINIHIDWSWLFIFSLITWNLATVFRTFQPDWPAIQTWGLGAGSALLFFASVLAHEMAHSLVARSQGLPVRRITLFIFGGVSNIEREPDSPNGEFWMSIMGPITSLVIGAVLLFGAGAAVEVMPQAMTSPQELLAQVGPLGTIAMWLGTVNVALGLFNLIPAFPLDGGRVVRSIFWSITGDLRRSTRWATGLGQVFAWAFIFAGIAMVFGAEIPLLGRGLLNGMWLAFIGWFLSNAASRSYRHVVIQDILSGVPVTQMMRRDPPTVPPDMDVSHLVHDQVMGTDDYGFPVIDQGQLVGLVTLEDVRGVDRGRWDGTTVREIMTKRDDLMVVEANEDASTAFDRIMSRDVRQLPVLENGTLIGLLRRQDLVRWLQIQSEAEL